MTPQKELGAMFSQASRPLSALPKEWKEPFTTNRYIGRTSEL